jgi:hypothetical protein
MSVCPWQCNGHCRPRTGDTVQVDGTMVTVDNLLAYRQPQTRTLLPFGGVEGLKGVCQVLHRHADAGVAEHYPHVLVGGLVGLNMETFCPMTSRAV